LPRCQTGADMPSEWIHKFTAQTMADAIADTISRYFKDFTYKLHITAFFSFICGVNIFKTLRLRWNLAHILWVWEWNIEETEFWVSVPTPRGATSTTKLVRSVEMTNFYRGAHYAGITVAAARHPSSAASSITPCGDWSFHRPDSAADQSKMSAHNR